MHALAGAVWAFLTRSRAPFEQVFFDWFGGRASEARAARSPIAGTMPARTSPASTRRWFRSRRRPAPGSTIPTSPASGPARC